MPKIDVSVPHRLAQQEAMSRIKGLVHQLKAEHGATLGDLREEWTADTGTVSFSAMGFALSGTVAVTPGDVRVSGDLPLAASFFKNQIEATIRDRAAALLA